MLAHRLVGRLLRDRPFLAEFLEVRLDYRDDVRDVNVSGDESAFREQGIDGNELAAVVDERSAAIARVDGERTLDHVGLADAVAVGPGELAHLAHLALGVLPDALGSRGVAAEGVNGLAGVGSRRGQAQHRRRLRQLFELKQGQVVLLRHGDHCGRDAAAARKFALVMVPIGDRLGLILLEGRKQHAREGAFVGDVLIRDDQPLADVNHGPGPQAFLKLAPTIAFGSVDQYRRAVQAAGDLLAVHHAGRQPWDDDWLLLFSRVFFLFPAVLDRRLVIPDRRLTIPGRGDATLHRPLAALVGALAGI